MPSTIADPAFRGVGQKEGIDIWRIEVRESCHNYFCFVTYLHNGT